MTKEQFIHQSSYSCINLKPKQFCSSLGFKWLLLQKQMMRKFHFTASFAMLLESPFLPCNAFDLVYFYSWEDLHPVRQIINYILDTYMTNCYDTLFLVTLFYLRKKKNPF